MQTVSRRFSTAIAALTTAVATLGFSAGASADPPSSVARLGYMSGAVSFSPAGEDDWMRAAINRPLTTGDRIWVDGRARAEMQVSGAVIRLGADTGMSILNLDDAITQLQVTQGVLNVRVRRLDPRHVFEIATPNLAFTLRRAGDYRVVVDADGDVTTIIVRNGQGEVYGEDASYVIDSRQSYRFTGTRLRDYEFFDAPRADEFDRWSSSRDRMYENSPSARYVSTDVIGYQDLDANGTWRSDATYGNVWFPNRVASGWAPYRDGHWSWIDPWGWTWVDDAPWGFAVSHYGRWTNLRGSWGWVPGPVRSRAYYAPALVAFVGGSNFQLSVSSGSSGGVAWFPLAPREVYRPAYATSRGYFENINRSNTVVNTTVINNYYNNTNVTNITYVNRQVDGAVIAVPTSTFVQSQPVGRAAVRVTPAMHNTATIAFAPTVAPTARSVRGSADQGNRPPRQSFERPVVARTEPPAERASFASQQPQLTARPGRPLDDADRRKLKPAQAGPAPAIKVIAPAQVAPPTAPPPRVAPEGRNDDRRGRRDDRQSPATAVVPAPSAVSPPVAPSAAPRVAPPEQTERSEQRGRGNARGQTTSVPAAPPAVAPPQSNVIKPAPPTQFEPPARVAPSPDQRGNGEARGQRAAPLPASPASVPESRGRSEERGKGRPDNRGQAVAPVPTNDVPPPVSRPAPASPASAPEPRGRSEERGKGRPDNRGPAVAPAPANDVPPPPARAVPAPTVRSPVNEQPAAVAAPRVAPQGAARPVEKPPVAKPEPSAGEDKPNPGKGRNKKQDRDESDEDDKRKKKD